MIPQSGVTSFDVCLQEVGETVGTEYGLEELITLFNQYSTMASPYITDYSFDDMKGFIGQVGNTFWQGSRYITSAEVWHFLEIYDVRQITIIVDDDPYPIYNYGVRVYIVNRSMVNSETAPILYYDIVSRPEGSGEWISSRTDITVSKSNKIVDYPYISHSYNSYDINLGQYPLPPLTFNWRFSESLPWNSVIVV